MHRPIDDHAPEGDPPVSQAPEPTDDRAAWDRAWGAMPHRRLMAAPRLDRGVLGVPTREPPSSWTISEDPALFADRAGRPASTCPICGTPTTAGARVPVTLHPRWPSGLTLGLGAWAHRACLDTCPLTDEPTPIPW